MLQKEFIVLNNELLLHNRFNTYTECCGIFFPDGVQVLLKSIRTDVPIEITYDMDLHKDMNGSYGIYLPNTLDPATPKIDLALDSNNWYSAEEEDYAVYNDNYLQLDSVLRHLYGISIHEDAFIVSFIGNTTYLAPKVYVGPNLNTKAEISPSNSIMTTLSNPVTFRSVDSTIPTDAQPSLNIAYVYGYY